MRARAVVTALSLALAAACGDAFVSQQGAGGAAATTGGGGGAATTGDGGHATGGGGDAATTTGGPGGGSAGGQGQGGAPACKVSSDCPPAASACEWRVCEAGECLRVLAQDGVPCDDGDPCTVDDACALGACVGAKLDCAPLDGPCTVGVCQGSACVVAMRDDGTACDDGNPCTSGDACQAGLCVGAAAGCVNGDGCCLAGCKGLDDDCTCTNLGPQGTASTSPSSGGPPNFAPVLAVDGDDEASCKYTWINGSEFVKDGWIEIAWGAPISVGSVYVDTVANAGGPCSLPAGRALLGAKLEWFEPIGDAWVPIGDLVAQQSGDLVLSLPVTITTQRLRLNHLSFGTAGNPVIFEWRVYGAPGCF